MTIETGLVTVIVMFLEFTIAQTLGIAHHGVYVLSRLHIFCSSYCVYIDVSFVFITDSIFCRNCKRLVLFFVFFE